MTITGGAKNVLCAAFILSAIFLLGRPAAARTEAATGNMTMHSAAPCDEPAYHTLDFWVGEWDVFDSQDGTKAGHSVLEKILQGCAIEVNWVGTEGEHVKEIFYYYKPKQKWIQVWIGDRGANKQRQSIELYKSGIVRFQGEVALMTGGSYLDRSTVTPLETGRVHQLIEISRDGGKSWHPTFDAEYRKNEEKKSEIVAPSGEKSVHYDSD
jgi:hypothetical protein